MHLLRSILDSQLTRLENRDAIGEKRAELFRRAQLETAFSNFLSAWHAFCAVWFVMVGERRDATSTPITQSESRSTKTKPFAESNFPENPSLSNGEQSDDLNGKFPKEASFIDGLKTVQLSDLKEGYKKPCVRDSLLTGIGAGFGIGGVRAVLGGNGADDPPNA